MTLPAARLATGLLAAVLTPLSRMDIAQESARIDIPQETARVDIMQEATPAGECPPAQAGM